MFTYCFVTSKNDVYRSTADLRQHVRRQLDHFLDFHLFNENFARFVHSHLRPLNDPAICSVDG